MAQALDGIDKPANGWKQFQLAERAARFGYWRLDLSTGNMFWSEGYRRLHGYESGVPAPDYDTLRNRLHPADLEILRQKIRNAIETKQAFYHRARFRDAEGPVEFLDTYGELETGENGEVVAVVGVCKDVTAEVRAEAARAAAQLKYEIMAEEASDIILLHDSQKLIFASSAFHRILGCNISEMQPTQYLALVHPDDAAEAKKVMVRPPQGETRTACYRIRHADGHYLWMELSTRAIYDDAQQLRYVISIGRDITERKKQELAMRAAQQRAEAASRAKSQFLANMSHELRTPLNAIIGFSDMMRQRMLGAELSRYEEYANLVYNSAQILLSHISGLLEMSHMEGGKMALKLADVKLLPFIEDCVNKARHTANECHIVCEFKCPADLSLRADAHALEQILFHLVSNALKFTQAGGHVLIEAAEVGNCAVITVCDDGMGIPESDLPRLGAPFEKLVTDPHIAKGTVGTGLGLALVRSLVEGHGGKLKIDSTLGEGTRVTVELPLHADEVRAA